MSYCSVIFESQTCIFDSKKKHWMSEDQNSTGNGDSLAYIVEERDICEDATIDKINSEIQR
jgi:hypothetical protein